MVTLIILSVACINAPVTREGGTVSVADGCAVRTEVVDGARVMIVGPKRPPLVRAQPRFRLAANREGTGKIIARKPRLWSTVLALMRDPSIGDFVQEMADDPDVTYYIWEMEFPRSGGGRTAECLGGFEIIIDLDYHLSTEGTACGNPRGSGSIESLLAHELGHAWAWRRYGPEEDCDNNSFNSKVSVAWENTQLKNGARRLVHAKPGCGCD